MKILVITISDRAFKGIYQDKSGPKIKEIILNEYPETEVEIVIVPDEENKIKEALKEGLNYNFIITTGGTGIGPRDITPEVTREFVEKELPGISEILRYRSYQETPQAMLSRGIAGIRGKTIIINFPGSVKAVTLCTTVILPILVHSQKMLLGEGH